MDWEEREKGLHSCLIEFWKIVVVFLQRRRFLSLGLRCAALPSKKNYTQCIISI